MATWKSFRKKLAGLVGEMALEAIATALAIGMIAGAHWLVELLIGKDQKFFDLIPVRWCFDAAHVALLLRLVWRIFRKLNDD